MTDRFSGESDADYEARTRRASWTIKAFPVEWRRRAVDAAAKQDLTMADWLEPVIRDWITRGADERVFPPKAKPSSAPAPATTGPVDVERIALMIDAGAKIMQMPPDLQRSARAAVRDGMRQSRGLPSLKSRATRSAGPILIEG